MESMEDRIRRIAAEIRQAQHLEHVKASIEAITQRMNMATPQATEEGPRYPNVTVTLLGEDGNAFAIIARVGKALRRSVDRSTEERFRKAALASKSYEDLLALVDQWVTVE